MTSTGSGPSISVLIPTLRRADTLRWSLKTVLGQTYPELEIVVQNNGDDEAVRSLVESFDDPRLRHRATSEVLSMADNWDAGLANCRGDVVTILGDDDGLMPDACGIAAQAFRRGECELLTWQNCMYCWPTYFDAALRNRLSVTVDFEFVLQRFFCLPLLRAFYRFETHYSNLPMIYNSFVSRSLVARVVATHGRYIVGGLPDVGSGVANVAYADSYVRSTRPLSIGGLSHHGTAHVHGGNKDHRPIPALLRRDFPVMFDTLEEGHSWNLQLVIARELELFHALGVVDPQIRIDRHGVLRAMARFINDDVHNYDATVKLIAQLASTWDIPLGQIAIPARSNGVRPLGLDVFGPGLAHFEIDGDSAGLQSVADAVRLVSQLVPAAEKLTWGPEPLPPSKLGRAPISFASGADGVGSLVSGWSTPETWGTWSVGEEAVVRFALSEPWSPDLRIGLRYRILPPLDGTPLVVECRQAGRVIQRWQLDAKRHRGELFINPSPPEQAEVLELTFANLTPRLPADLGLSADKRDIGIGLEEACVLSRATSFRRRAASVLKHGR